ncbi:hypothetical protein MKY51_16330 [Solibacillus sp. FSL R5-0691]|uniref:hypothetical protein n=1 Tax=Solibacillus sp. FSL R5-0691 TaxID=2921653 RepID=UPI0030CF2AD5
MNKKGFYVFLSICLVMLLTMLIAACQDEVLEIEESNTYVWQKYMNEEEYEKVKEGMSYLDVVRISGGAGQKINKDTYEWNDEILLTKGYRLKFNDEVLVKKEVVERKGNSKR